MSETILSQKINHKSLLTPPGTLLVWIVIINEMLIFAVVLVLLLRFRFFNLSIFTIEQQHLNLKLGLFYTFSLLLSGFFAAEGTKLFFQNQTRRCGIYFLLSATTGTLFLISKFFDYQNKLEAGLSIQRNDFWEYYWLATGFHYLHVLLGVFMLYFICWGIHQKKIKDPEFSIRGAVLFWHMCDLIWLFLFPIFYFR